MKPSLRSRATSSLWQEISYVLTYGNIDNTYGQKPDLGASIIAINKAWGNYVRRLFVSDKYQTTSHFDLVRKALDQLEN